MSSCTSGFPASLASISWVGFRNCDYAIIGARLGALQAGYYFRAYTLAIEYQKKISTVMAMLAFPLFSRTSDLKEMAHVRTQMIRTVTIVVFPLLVGLTILAPTIVPWVFGPAWEPAVVPTQILVVGGAATLVSDSVGAALLARGERARYWGSAGHTSSSTRLGVFLVVAATASRRSRSSPPSSTRRSCSSPTH